MILLTIFSLIASAEMILFPIISRNLINNAIDLVSNKVSFEQSAASFGFLIILFAALELVQSLVGVGSTYYQNKFTALFEKLFRLHVFKHLTTLSIEFFENEKIGKLTNKISRGINRASNLLQILANWLLSQIINYFVVIIIFFYLNVYVGILCVVISAIFLIVSYDMTKKLKPLHKKINKRNDAINGHLIEVLSNMHVVRNFAMEEREVSEFNKESDEFVDLYVFRARKRLKYSAVRNFLSTLITIGALSITGYYVLIGKMTPGDIFLVQAYIRYIQWPLWNFSWMYDEASESMRSIDDIVKLLETKPKVTDLQDAKSLLVKDGSVEFKDITFSYKGKKNEPVFKKLNFKVAGGESVALVGPSGVGKSTIIKVLSRLYDPNKGQILVDGQDIKHVKQESYRKHLGIVSQQTVLFNDTIKNNIKYGNPKAKEKDVIAAAKAANIHDFIMNLPKKYNTVVGERGIKLSGGESQRVSIARAILKDPKILVLDEATSSLDSQSEKLIQEALWKLIEGRTTFIIAHRLSTVMKADEILVIDKGEIVERGSHEKLIKSKGLYSELFNIQSGAFLLAEGEENSKLGVKA